MPNWVSEGSVRKYNRAAAFLAKENAIRKAGNLPENEVTEEALKALYVKWGGLVVGEIESARGNDHPEDAMEVAEAEVKTRKGKKK